MGRTLLLLGLLLCWSAQGQGNLLETQVKATFLYKFCQYVHWPDTVFADSAAPIIIGVFDAKLLADELKQTVKGRKIHGRSMEVLLLADGEFSVGLHILFAGGTRGLTDLVDKLQYQPILTVTEQADSAFPGMINFVVENDRVRFDIAQDRVEQVGLKLSSQLLSVARHVKKGQIDGG